MTTKLKFLWVLLALLVGGVNGVWADEVTFNYSVSRETSLNGISITGGSYSSGGYYGIASENVFTISSTVGNITAITLNYTSGDANRRGGSITVSPGSYSLSGNVGTWSGNASSIAFTTTNSARIVSFTVTYSATTLTAVYNKTWEFSSLAVGTGYTNSGNIIDNLEINGVDANNNIKVDNSAGSKTFTVGSDSYTFTQYLWISGSGSGGDNTSRNLHFKVAGNCKVEAFFYNYSGDERSLALYMNGSQVEAQAAAAGSTAILSYSYSGGTTDAYLYSTNSGLDLYAIKVTPLSSTTTTINIADLCYEHYYFGSDLNRNVAGFDLTAEGNIVSQTVSGNYYLLYRAGATVRIQPNSSNSSARIIRVKYFGSGFTAALGSSSDTEYLAYNGDGVEYIEFTNNTGQELIITSVEITTDRSMSWSKITPTLTFSPNSAIYLTNAGEQNLGDLNTGTLRTSPKSFRLSYSISSNGTGTTKDYHMSGKYLGVTPGNSAGSETLTALFDGSSNPYFSSASATFGVTISTAADTYTGAYTPTTSTDLSEGTPVEVGGATVYQIDGKVRNLKGTYTFTGAGTLTGGTIIDAVPGITMQIGVASNTWTVTNCGTNEAPVYAAFCADGASGRGSRTIDGGGFYRFTPYVNGYLTVNARTGTISGISVPDHNNSTGYMFVYEGTVNKSGNINYQTGSDYDVAFPLLAGHTYDLCCQYAGFYLHSFTFKPAFLQIDQSTGEINNTQASKDSDNPESFNLNTPVDRFPHLITSAAGEGKVKFADAPVDATIDHLVNISSNNNVQLLKDGKTLMKGTVLLEGSDRELFTYYYLQSNILTLSNTYRVQSGSSTEETITNQEYVEEADLENGKYEFVFNHDIAENGTKYKVYFKRLGIDTNELELKSTNPSWVELTGAKLIVNIQDLDPGRTYKIRIPAGCVKQTGEGNEGVQNSEIIRYFTVKDEDGGEAQVTMIYPTDLAHVGTAIVLETKNADGTTNKGLDQHHFVTGTLTAPGETPMSITAWFDDRNLVFKPTSTLKSNTQYTLTIVPTQIYMKDNGNKVTKTKEFVFTTGTAVGTAPVIKTTSPSQNETVTVREGSITFEFDQNIELERYSTLLAIPVNGSEATANGRYGMGSAAGSTTLTVSSDGKTLQFPYTDDQLKYDLFYKVEIPANTVIGAGGTPNSEPITLNFKMAKKSSSISKIGSSSFTGYPFTWDFTKFGVLTDTQTKLSEKATNDLKSTTRWLYDNSNNYYGNYSQGVDFPQGEVLSYYNGTQDVEIAEAQGIRWSLTKKNASSVNHRIRFMTGATSSLYVMGNTHYLTIPDVPVGKLYVKVKRSDVFNINSPNAHFVQGGMFEDNTKGEVTTTSKVYILDITEAGDVSFCLDDVNIEMIAVPTDEKTFRKEFAENGKTYATDRLGYDVRYDLLNAFTDHNVKPYYVSAMTNNESDNTATFTATEVNPANAVKGDQGVIAVYQSALSADATVPMFKTDVNTAPLDASENGNGTTVLKNLLKVGETGSTALPTVDEDKYLYVLSYQGSKSSGIGFYRYVGTTFSDRAAYLAVDKSWVEPSTGSQGNARALRIVFVDADDSQTTLIRDIETEGVSEVGGRPTDYYDLRGLRLSRPVKPGLYIKDGRKVYVK